MNKRIEMIFIDELDEFMKLVEALNAGDQACPVYLAFRNRAAQHWMLATETVQAAFSWQDKEIETSDVNVRIEKFTFVVKPTKMIWGYHDTSLESKREF